MPSAPKSETPEQREARLIRQRRYEAAAKERDPEAWREKTNAAARAYRKRHPERSKASVKKHRIENRDQFNANRRAWRVRNIERSIFLEARSRAKKRGVEFSISFEDIPPMGEVCPLLGNPFEIGVHGRSQNSPSLDRKNPKLGYIPGNVWFVGYRANLIKNDGTAQEHEMIAAAMKSQGVH